MAPALRAGLFSLLPIFELIETCQGDLRSLQTVVEQTLPMLDTSWRHLDTNTPNPMVKKTCISMWSRWV